MLIYCLDLPLIAYALERGCKYEVKRYNKKARYSERRVSTFLEARSKGSWLLLNNDNIKKEIHTSRVNSQLMIKSFQNS